VNKESLPLILSISIPIALVGVILLYIYGYDITSFFRRVHIIYYIVIFPIGLGFLVALMKWKKGEA